MAIITTIRLVELRMRKRVFIWNDWMRAFVLLQRYFCVACNKLLGCTVGSLT